MRSGARKTSETDSDGSEIQYAVASAKSAMSKRSKQIVQNKADWTAYWFLMIIVAITLFTYPEDWDAKTTSQHVFYYGWITALSTGAGILPFIFFSDPDKFWMGISNGVAAGMMLSASFSLAYEGATFEDAAHDLSREESFWRTTGGFFVGIMFILVSKKLLDRWEGMDLVDMQGADAQRMILIMLVMTLHSLSEGIGIGVSFGGKSGSQLGHFISMSLAVHNVPEGIAVALVLTSKKVSKLRTALWAIFTSLPQPLTAIPAYLFVEKFVPLLPAGLGFASGAMTYVALFELLPEAVEDTDSVPITAGVALIATGIMTVLQEGVRLTVSYDGYNPSAAL